MSEPFINSRFRPEIPTMRGPSKTRETSSAQGPSQTRPTQGDDFTGQIRQSTVKWGKEKPSAEKLSLEKGHSEKLGHHEKGLEKARSDKYNDGKGIHDEKRTLEKQGDKIQLSEKNPGEKATHGEKHSDKTLEKCFDKQGDGKSIRDEKGAGEKLHQGDKAGDGKSLHDEKGQRDKLGDGKSILEDTKLSDKSVKGDKAGDGKQLHDEKLRDVPPNPKAPHEESKLMKENDIPGPGPKSLLDTPPNPKSRLEETKMSKENDTPGPGSIKDMIDKQNDVGPKFKDIEPTPKFSDGPIHKFVADKHDDKKDDTKLTDGGPGGPKWNDGPISKFIADKHDDSQPKSILAETPKCRCDKVLEKNNEFDLNVVPTAPFGPPSDRFFMPAA